MIDPSPSLPGLDHPPKICCTCRRLLPVEQFHRHAKTRDGLKTHCIECGNAYMRRYRTQSPVGRMHAAAGLLRQKNSRRAVIIEAKQGKECLWCGESRVDALTFHHREPAKKAFPISRGSGRVSPARLRAEIAKCDILCASCHHVHDTMQKRVVAAFQRIAKTERLRMRDGSDFANLFDAFLEQGRRRTAA